MRDPVDVSTRSLAPPPEQPSAGEPSRLTYVSVGTTSPAGRAGSAWLATAAESRQPEPGSGASLTMVAVAALSAMRVLTVAQVACENKPG